VPNMKPMERIEPAYLPSEAICYASRDPRGPYGLANKYLNAFEIIIYGGKMLERLNYPVPNGIVRVSKRPKWLFRPAFASEIPMR
jgi:hypothetical protein